jgi:ketosteroid isomerase-like protein
LPHFDGGIRVNAPATFARPPRTRARHAAFAMALVLLVWAFAGCHRTPAEQQVREAIDAAAAAARANDAHGVLEFVSDEFTGNEGVLDRRGLRQLLAVRALRQDKTGVLIGPVAFEHKGDRIVAKFNLVLTGGKPGDLLPEQSAVYAMTTAWRREGGQWICYSASWSR